MYVCCLVCHIYGPQSNYGLYKIYILYIYKSVQLTAHAQGGVCVLLAAAPESILKHCFHIVGGDGAIMHHHLHRLLHLRPRRPHHPHL